MGHIGLLLQNLKHFPMLKELSVSGHAVMEFNEKASSNSIEIIIFSNHTGHINSFSCMSRFPNLVEIDSKGMPSMTDILSYLPDCPKVKSIRMNGATAELARYCSRHGITLS